MQHWKISRRVASGLVIMIVSLAGCAPSARITAGGEEAVLDRLYFGRSIPGGGSVSDDDWRGFLRDAVTPRFPDGITVWRGEGQWRDSGGSIIREETFILELIHPSGSAADSAITAIIGEYREMFRQESVMWVRDEIGVRF